MQSSKKKDHLSCIAIIASVCIAIITKFNFLCYIVGIPIMSSSSSVAIIPTATVHIIDSQSSHIASASTPTSSLSSTFSSSVTIMSTTTVDIIDSQSSHIASASTPTSSLPPTFPTVYITIVVITLLILVTVIVLTLLVAFLGCPNCNNTSKCIILLYNYNYMVELANVYLHVYLLKLVHNNIIKLAFYQNLVCVF